MVRSYLKNNIQRMFLKGHLRILTIPLILALAGCSDLGIFSRLFYVLDHESEFDTIPIERAARYDGFRIIRGRKILMFGFKGPPSPTERLDLGVLQRISERGNPQIKIKVEQGKMISAECIGPSVNINNYMNRIFLRSMAAKCKYTEFFEEVEMRLTLEWGNGKPKMTIDLENVSVEQPRGQEARWICYTISTRKAAAQFLFPQHGFDVSIGSTDHGFRDMKNYESRFRNGEIEASL